MPAKILHQLTIKGLNGTGQFYSLNGRFFRSNGVDFEITGSEITGPGPYDVVHTVKNVVKGTFADIQMQKLITILLKAE